MSLVLALIQTNTYHETSSKTVIAIVLQPPKKCAEIWNLSDTRNYGNCSCDLLLVIANKYFIQAILKIWPELQSLSEAQPH